MSCTQILTLSPLKGTDHFAIGIMKHRVCSFLTALLVTCSVVHAESNYWILSAHEQTINPTSCTLYFLNSKDKKLAERINLSPPRNIRLVQTFPKKRRIAVWQYANQNEKTIKDSGYVVTVDIDTPHEQKEQVLSFRPIFGGYWFNVNDGSIITQGMRNEQYRLREYNPDSRTMVSRDIRNLDWEKCLLYGTNFLHEMGAQQLNIEINADGGLLACSGTIKYPLPFNLDAEGLELFQGVKGRLAIPCLDDRTLVLNTPGANKGFYILDRQSGNWKHLVISSDSAVCQMFDDYLVVQEIRMIDSRKEKLFPSKGRIGSGPDGTQLQRLSTGVYEFFDRQGNAKLKWQTTPDTELIAVWDHEILFRRGESLFRAQIIGDMIRNEEELCNDPAILNVHWAFPEEK